jgi:hypothetical protein
LDSRLLGLPVRLCLDLLNQLTDEVFLLVRWSALDASIQIHRSRSLSHYPPFEVRRNSFGEAKEIDPLLASQTECIGRLLDLIA